MMPGLSLVRQNRSSRLLLGCATLALLSVLLVGCGSGSKRAATIDTESDYSANDVATRTVTYATGGTTLVATLSTPQTHWMAGMPIPLNVTITNTGTATYTYTLCGLSAYAQAATYPDGKEVWDSTYGEAIPLFCQGDVTLAPGQSVSDQVTWNGKANGGDPVTGTYAITLTSARLPSGNGAPAIPPLVVTLYSAPSF